MSYINNEGFFDKVNKQPTNEPKMPMVLMVEPETLNAYSLEDFKEEIRHNDLPNWQPYHHDDKVRELKDNLIRSNQLLNQMLVLAEHNGRLCKDSILTDAIRIQVTKKECHQNNQAACLFDRDAALEELAHAKESLVAERLSAGELAKQNHKMKEALKERIKFVELSLASSEVINNRAAAIYYLHPHNEASPLSGEVRYTKWEAIGNKGMYLQIARWHFDNELTDLRQILASVSDLSSLTVLSRAEVEKLPCTCFPQSCDECSGSGGFSGHICPRCAGSGTMPNDDLCPSCKIKEKYEIKKA